MQSIGITQSDGDGGGKKDRKDQLSFGVEPPKPAKPPQSLRCNR